MRATGLCRHGRCRSGGRPKQVDRSSWGCWRSSASVLSMALRTLPPNMISGNREPPMIGKPSGCKMVGHAFRPPGVVDVVGVAAPVVVGEDERRRVPTGRRATTASTRCHSEVVSPWPGTSGSRALERRVLVVARRDSRRSMSRGSVAGGRHGRRTSSSAPAHVGWTFAATTRDGELA